MLYIHVPEQATLWQQLLQAELPELPVLAHPQAVDAAAVRFLATWRPPEGLFAQFPRLQAVFALGAGVDRLLARPDLPASVALIRLNDAGMAAQMLEYVWFGLLRFQRGMDDYLQQQRAACWQPLAQREAGQMRVSVLGLGAIGSVVATQLATLGYRVSGWSNSPKALPGVDCRHGLAALDPLLAQSDALVMILPNTPQTQGLIDARRLGLLPRGAIVINAGRGEQLDLDALLTKLNSAQLGGAQLDVFCQEPLRADHPAWQTPNLYITPHVAALTLPAPSARQVATSLRALLAGQPVPGLVLRSRAY